MSLKHNLDRIDMFIIRRKAFFYLKKQDKNFLESFNKYHSYIFEREPEIMSYNLNHSVNTTVLFSKRNHKAFILHEVEGALSSINKSILIFNKLFVKNVKIFLKKKFYKVVKNIFSKPVHIVKQGRIGIYKRLKN